MVSWSYPPFKKALLKFKWRKELCSLSCIPMPQPQSSSIAGLATNSIFFQFPFGKKSLICLESKSITPHRGSTFLFRSYQQLPHHRLGPLKGFLSWHGLPELKRCTDTVKCVALAPEVPGHCQKKLTQTLIVHLLKTHFFTLIRECEK